jgi:hypothetical protein
MKNKIKTEDQSFLVKAGTGFEAVGNYLREVKAFPYYETIGETAITYHDNNFNIISANKAAKEMLGLPSLMGAEVKCYQYYHGKDSPPKQCPSCKCSLTSEPVFFEYFEPHLHKYMQIKAFPHFDKNNEFKGLIHFVRDITDEYCR